MNNTVELTYIDTPEPKTLFYKRMIWLGIREAKPRLNSRLHANTTRTLQEELDSVRTNPCLIVWDTTAGEKRYAEVRKVIVKSNQND